MATPVAAAASVPSSFTSTNALWTTAEMKRSFLPSMPEKSAMPAGEGVLHAHGGQRAGQAELAGHLELRHRQDDLLAAETRQVLAQHLRRQGLLDRRQAVDLLRQDDDHRQFVAGVRQLHGLIIGGLLVSELLLEVHQRGLDVLAAAQVERLIPGAGLLERVGPLALEVDGVRQDQPRVGSSGCRACRRSLILSRVSFSTQALMVLREPSVSALKSSSERPAA